MAVDRPGHRVAGTLTIPERTDSGRSTGPTRCSGIAARCSHCRTSCPSRRAAAELRAAGFGFDLVVVGVDTAVPPGEVDRFAGADAGDRAAVPAGQVQPVVEAKAEAVHPVLRIPFFEAGEQRLLLIGAAVAVGVLRVDDRGGGGDQCAVSPGDDAGRKSDAVEKRDRLVVATVVIDVREDADAATRLSIVVSAVG